MLSTCIRRGNINAIEKCTKRCKIQPLSAAFSSSSENENKTQEFFTEGEWKGCTKRFLKPLRIKSRGSG